MSNQLSQRVGREDQLIPFTCCNSKYQTNVKLGYEHGKGNAKGSVFETALITRDDESLWLEHVTETGSDAELFWLMWYKGGRPAVKSSGVFNRTDYAIMMAKLPATLS